MNRHDRRRMKALERAGAKRVDNIDVALDALDARGGLMVSLMDDAEKMPETAGEICRLMTEHLSEAWQGGCAPYAVGSTKAGSVYAFATAKLKKHEVWMALATAFHELGINRYVYMVEAWTAPDGSARRPSEHPDREEVAMVTAVGSDGSRCVATAPLTRSHPDAELGDLGQWSLGRGVGIGTNLLDLNTVLDTYAHRQALY